MAEWSNALVLKTSEGHTSGGSNPSSSATKTLHRNDEAFFISRTGQTQFEDGSEIKKASALAMRFGFWILTSGITSLASNPTTFD